MSETAKKRKPKPKPVVAIQPEAIEAPPVPAETQQEPPEPSLDLPMLQLPVSMLQLSAAAIQPEFMTLDGIASYISISKSTLDRWRASGHLPKPDIVKGGVMRWGRKTIDAWGYGEGGA